MTGWHLFFSKQKKGIFLSLLIITACQEGGPSQTAGVFQGDKEQCVLRLVTLWCWAGRCEVSVILRDDTKHHKKFKTITAQFLPKQSFLFTYEF